MQSLCLEGNIRLAGQDISLSTVEFEGSLLRSQEFASFSYPNPDGFSTHPHTPYFYKIHFVVIPSASGFLADIPSTCLSDVPAPFYPSLSIHRAAS